MKLFLIKTFFIIAFFTVTAPIYAQYEDVEVEEEVEIEEYEPDLSYSKRETDNNYKTQVLVDNYTLTYKSVGRSSYQKIYGLMEGKTQILPTIFSYKYLTPDKSKLVLGLSGKFGIYNFKQKTWNVPLVYSTIEDLGKDLYKVSIGNRYGIINSYNNVLVDFEWSQITNIRDLENYYIVRDHTSPNPNFGIYSVLANKMTVKPIYSSINKIATDDAFTVQNELKMYNLVDVKGNLKFKNWYSSITPEAGGKPRYIVVKEGKWGIIDNDEKNIVPITFRVIQTRPCSDGSYLAQNEKGKYGFITIDGEITLPFVYDNLAVQSYSGVGISSSKNKCGIVKVNNGKPYELATCEYDDISLNNNVFIIEQDKKFGIMDLYGKLTTEIKYDALEIVDTKLYKAKLNGKFFLLNAKGEQISDQSFTELTPIYASNTAGSYYNYNTRFSYVKTKTTKGKCGVMDKVGIVILEASFDDILSEANNILLVKQDGKLGLYSLYTKTFLLPAEYDQLVYDNSSYYGFKGSDIYQISLGSSIVVNKIN